MFLLLHMTVDTTLFVSAHKTLEEAEDAASETMLPDNGGWYAIVKAEAFIQLER